MVPGPSHSIGNFLEQTVLFSVAIYPVSWHTKHMEATPTLTAAELLNFTGTGNWYRHGLVRRVLFTDGVRFIADRAGAYWLVDEIATAQMLPLVAAEEFQLWHLSVSGTSAVLTCGDGNGEIIYRKGICFTDFPLPEIKLYFTNNVICLPSEN